MTTDTLGGNDLDHGDLNFSIDLSAPDPKALAEGFNQYGVRETDDRVEFIFEAMQTGMRNGVKITEDFLKTVASNFENEAPVQIDHDRSMESNVGRVTEMWFSDGALRLRGYVPKTGANTHQEFIQRFTFSPPQVQNGSVGFGMQYELSEDDDGNPMLVNGTMQEFSLLPFPGGYDESTGGLKAQFEQAYQQYQDEADGTDDDTPEDDVSGVESFAVRFDTETIYNSNTMTFERIEFTDLPDDLPEEVVEFIENVEEQHEANVEFVESVTDDRDEAEEELQEYKQTLAGKLAEREAVLFEAEELVEFDLSRLHKLDEDSQDFGVSEDEAGAEDEPEGEGGENFGQKDRKSGNFTEDTVDERATEGLDSMTGISLN